MAKKKVVMGQGSQKTGFPMKKLKGEGPGDKKTCSYLTEKNCQQLTQGKKNLRSRGGGRMLQEV